MAVHFVLNVNVLFVHILCICLPLLVALMNFTYQMGERERTLAKFQICY